jgi:uncharacterized protein YggE
LRRSGSVAVLAALLLATGTATAVADAGDPHSWVAVSGQGSASAPADMAVINAGVSATQTKAKDATDAASAAAQSLLNAAQGQGVAAQDISTLGLSLFPDYSFSNGNAQITGYTSAQSFAIKVHDIAKTGAILQAITDATRDAGRIFGVSFDVADHSPLISQARAAAFANVKAKAQQYADLTGHTLGDVYSLNEASFSGVLIPPMPFSPPGVGSAGTVPLAPGQITDNVNVTATYWMN